ncbi:hypothetical protein EBR25_03800 [bacterium]|nr:hypothetical protein [bacterium]
MVPDPIALRRESSLSVMVFFIIIVTALSLCVLLPASSAPFISTGEPREAVVSQSMLLHNDLSYAVRYGDDIATKPPLLHWLIVFSAMVHGELTELTSRLPSIISAVSILLTWGLVVSSLMGISIGVLTTAILLSSSEWLRHASLARVDMLLAATSNLALIALFYWIKERKVLFLLLSAIPLSLAALTKGPIGVLLPLFLVFTLLIIRRELKFGMLIQLAILSVSALTPLLFWYWNQMEASDGASFNIFLSENIDRLLGRMSKGEDPHLHGSFYLAGSLLTGILPWSLFCIPLLFSVIRKRSDIQRKYNELGSAQKQLLQFALATTIIWFCFYLLPSSKRGVYLLPAYPSIALLLAMSVSYLESKCQKLLRRSAVIFAIFFLVLWLLVTLFLLNPASLEALISSPKALAKTQWYGQLLAIKSDALSAGILLSLLLPVFLIGSLLHLHRKQLLPPSLLFCSSFLVVYVGVKIQIILPVAQALSPENALRSLFSERRPKTVTLNDARLYAPVFYLRRAYPEVAVTAVSSPQAVVLGVIKTNEERKQSQIISAAPSLKPDRHLYIEQESLSSISEQEAHITYLK